jgi:N-acetyl-gamma-glutamyl-phosphate reductase
MEASLGARVLFTPHLLPINRGILATCYGTATREMDAGAPLEALRAAYAEEPFVHVTDQSPATKWTLGSNAVQVTARYDARTGRVLAISALDNLVKGAAGQMIQCANLMLGFNERAGLSTVGVYP